MIRVFRNTEFLADIVKGNAVRSVVFFSDGSADSREYHWLDELVEEVHCREGLSPDELPPKYRELALHTLIGPAPRVAFLGKKEE